MTISDDVVAGGGATTVTGSRRTGGGSGSGVTVWAAALVASRATVSRLPSARAATMCGSITDGGPNTQAFAGNRA